MFAVQVSALYRTVNPKVLTVVCAAVLFGGVGVARAGCAGPGLMLPSGQRAAVGEQVEVEGTAWAKLPDCEDPDSGCAWDDGDAPTGEPYVDIELSLVGPLTPELRRLHKATGEAGDGEIREVIGEADADETGHFLTTFEVPDVPPGDYLIDAGQRSEAIEITVTASP